MLNDGYRYKILKLVEASPEISQRDLAKRLGVSLGKVNYCFKSLMHMDMLKVLDFCNSKNKSAYVYLLTTSSVEEKAKVAARFLKNKIQEYETLKKEIAFIKPEVKNI